MSDLEANNINSTTQPADEQPMMPSPEEEETTVKKKYGGIMPKKPPLISKDHERAFFDSADWALGKGAPPGQKPKTLVEALRPKLQEEIAKEEDCHPRKEKDFAAISHASLHVLEPPLCLTQIAAYPSSTSSLKKSFIHSSRR